MHIGERRTTQKNQAITIPFIEMCGTAQHFQYYIKTMAMEERKQDNRPSASPENEKRQIAENNPSKAMDSKREVENANDPKIDQDFPGYPHYPAKEDMMDKRTDSHRVDEDVENLPNSNNVTGVSQRFRAGADRRSADESQGSPRSSDNPDSPDDFSDMNPRTENTRAGLDTLGSTNAEIGIPQNVDSDDLDKRTPGTDLGNDDLDMRSGTEADVTPEERAALENVSMPTRDEDNLRRSALDTTDFDGEQLNEDSFGERLDSADLDIPDEVDETTTSSLGQGDEENKYYSLGSDRHESQEEDPYSGPERDNY